MCADSPPHALQVIKRSSQKTQAKRSSMKVSATLWLPVAAWRRSRMRRLICFDGLVPP